jgi:hypothetical protein
MLRFALTILIIIVPLLAIINIIVNALTIANEGYSSNNLIISATILLAGSLFVFIVGLVIGTITYIIDKSDIIEEKDNKITTGRLIINEDHIYQIKARRFIFLYAFTIYTKHWKMLGLLTYYFNNKEELIDFINEYKFFIKYIREIDLNKLEIK